ncbi:MAG TPA: fatty acid desaturase [Labilithrix sp.]|nr:fatty acid desaturase [Labilithrix sp.]
MAVHLDELTLTDPVYRPKASHGPVDRFFLRFINDERDLPFVHFMVEATLVVIPFALYLYLGTFRWWLAAIYLPLNFAWYMDRFILILHNTSHRPLFRKKYRFLNSYIPWILGPFFGESPETYFVHHVGMHHVEENLQDDLSSTMAYRRDSFVGWLTYFLRFFFFGLGELALYFAKKRRRKLLARLLTGEIGFVVFVVLASVFNWRATLVVFIIPLLFCRFMMMVGNWAQHAFIDPQRPEDPFTSSITVVNCRYNRRSFNDGYHIGHHRRATRHWTEMPVELDKDRALYAERNAIVFHGIDFTTVWFFLMLKRYDLLARHFVETQRPARTQDEVVAFLRGRTQPVVDAAGVTAEAAQ